MIDKYKDEMRRVVEEAEEWWIDQLIPPMEGPSLPGVEEQHRQNFGAGPRSWIDGFRKDLRGILEEAACQLREQSNYIDDPMAGHKRRTVGLSKWARYDDEMYELLDRYDIEPEDTQWPEDSCMSLCPFLVFVRRKKEGTSEVIYRVPRRIT